MKKITLIFYLFWTIIGQVVAQIELDSTLEYSENIQENEEQLVLSAKNTGDKILLRWAPSNPEIWTLGNLYGYTLERLAFKDSSDYLQSNFIPLTSEPIKPWSLEKWEEEFNVKNLQDTMAAVVAQTIHGERFYHRNKDGTATWLDQARELKNLHSFTLLAAEFSSIAAIGAGLRFEDTTIDPEKTYIYRLYIFGDSIAVPIDTVYSVIGGNEFSPLDPPLVQQIIEAENAVQIQWSISLNSRFFSAYYIERSDNGQTWKRLTPKPYISNPGELNSDTYYYLDSLKENYKPYWYRLIGITPFAEFSPPSEPIKAMARDRTPPKPPFNVRAEAGSDYQMEITWETLIPEPDLEGYYISKRKGANGIPEYLHEDPIPANINYFKDEVPEILEDVIYFVAAVDTAGNWSASYPAQGNYQDSLPPLPPTGLVGEIDTNGIVTLKWNLGKAPDLIGYKILYTNQEDHVYVNFNNLPHKDTVYVDTLPIYVLSEEIFFKVVALDYYHNHSEPSEVLIVKRPDIVPPASPLLTDYLVSEKGIYLTWTNSISADAELHQLYRRKVDSTKWNLVYSSKDIIVKSYLDTQTVAGVKYEYRIEAVDDAGLTSAPTFTLILKSIDFSNKPKVDQFSAELKENGIGLDWHYPIKGDYQFVLLKATNGSNFFTLKSLPKSTSSFLDENLKTDTQYEYTIKVVYRDGKESNFSNFQRVVIPEDKEFRK